MFVHSINLQEKLKLKKECSNNMPAFDSAKDDYHTFSSWAVVNSMLSSIRVRSNYKTASNL